MLGTPSLQPPALGIQLLLPYKERLCEEREKNTKSSPPSSLGGGWWLRKTPGGVFAPSEKGEWRATTPGLEPGAFETPLGAKRQYDSNNP